MIFENYTASTSEVSSVTSYLDGELAGEADFQFPSWNTAHDYAKNFIGKNRNISVRIESQYIGPRVPEPLS